MKLEEFLMHIHVYLLAFLSEEFWKKEIRLIDVYAKREKQRVRVVRDVKTNTTKYISLVYLLICGNSSGRYTNIFHFFK